MEPFKNLYSLDAARRIAQALHRAYPAFSENRFLHRLGPELDKCELKARMFLLAARIQNELPKDPDVLFPILCASLAQDENDACGLKGFSVWPLTTIVAQCGLNHLEASMTALCEMTQRFTAEFAIRPFLIHHQERTLAQLHVWTAHPSEHVRRLVSEGSRPLLPWGEHLPAIKRDPSLTLPLLEALRNDPSEYVRRSVANHLNDHAKEHPDFIISVLQRWLNTDKKPSRELLRLSRHATRTLLKAGHPGALQLHGYAPAESLQILEVNISPDHLSLGEDIHYCLSIKNTSQQSASVIFDYAIHHLKANNSHTPKVFKGRIRTLQPGETWEITGHHPFRTITTRRYYPGIHYFEPRINGAKAPHHPFTLLIP